MGRDRGDEHDSTARFPEFFRKPPRQARSRALVGALLHALDERIRASSLDAITINDLSHRAGVAAASFYEYFTGKDALLGALIEQVTQRNFVELERRLAKRAGASLRTLVDSFAEDAYDEYVAHPTRTTLIIEGAARLGVLPIINRERDRFADVVMTPRARACVPQVDASELAQTMRIVADAAMGMMVGELTRTPPTPREQVVRDLAAAGWAIICDRHPEVANPS